MGIQSIGIVGYRGMVGSVLLERMRAEGDFDPNTTWRFYSSRQAGEPGPSLGASGASSDLVRRSDDIDQLAEHDLIVTCQGSAFTQEAFEPLRARGWQGYWVDAASAKRMDDDSVIVLDPVNRTQIDRAVDAGVKNFIGGNCTVSLMLMALHGLFREDLVEWMSCVTYQAASGGGARHMRELLAQMATLGEASAPLRADPNASILDVDRAISDTLHGGTLPTEQFGAPLAASLLPWIDSAMDAGDTREEWKAFAEGNKLLGRSGEGVIPIDSLCVRVGAMRSHSQGFTIKLRRDVPLRELEQCIAEANDWVELVENDKASTLNTLTPAVVSGTLRIPVGRLRKPRLGADFLSAFTVGDQLLWGAAEPLRRVVNILRNGAP